MSRTKRSGPDLPVGTNPANPEIFGIDVADAVWSSLGLVTTAVVNDRVVQPAVKGVLPGVYQNEIVGKLVDSGTTLLVASLLGGAVDYVNRPIARRVQFGGGIYAGAKLISIVLPGFTIGQPSFGHLPFLPSQPALPPASSSNSQQSAPAPALQPSMGL